MSTVPPGTSISLCVVAKGGCDPAAFLTALQEQDFLCRIFGQCLEGDPLDREVGTVIGQGIRDVPKLFTYVRYNAELSRADVG